MKTTLFHVLFLSTAVGAYAQSSYRAWDLPAVAAGNEESATEPIANDFRVLRPVTVTELGMFDSGGDGVAGNAVITVQLCESSPESKASTPLETVTFTAGSAGELRGGFRYKPLAVPLTLLPGHYTLTAGGFDEQNPELNTTRRSRQPAVLSLNDGGGCLKFLGCHRRNDLSLRSREDKNMGAPDRFAAATLGYNAAALPASPFAVDYAALTAGVSRFPVEGGKSNIHNRVMTLNRYGSIALWGENAFPVVMEPSGNRLILEAGGIYNNDPKGARCVVFSHEQFGHVAGDGRMALFENAIKWAGRKKSAGNLVVGLSTNLDAAYFTGRGYQVKLLDPGMKMKDPNSIAGCDVVVVDFHGEYTERFMTRLREHTAKGGGLVATFLPWRYVHAVTKPQFVRVNTLLKPFGLAYRTSLTRPVDFGFTEIQQAAYAPGLFNALPAADLLRQEREGKTQLSNLEKATALNTIAYAADRQPDLLATLTAKYSGQSAAVGAPAGAGEFTDVVALDGSAGTAVAPSQWQADEKDLIAQGRRGSVEYKFNLSGADLYRLQVFGVQNQTENRQLGQDLVLWVDGVKLGRYILPTTPGVSGKVECLTPFLNAGSHTLKILWDNAEGISQLRLQGVHLQATAGSSGLKPWVAALIDSQSGLDASGDTLTSYVSPLCLEGRDPYPELMSADVSGANVNTPKLKPVKSPNARWYVNVPLAGSGDTAFRVSYENGAKSEVRRLRWLPLNVLGGGNITIRKGDSLAFVAAPEGTDTGTMRILVGTNQYLERKVSSPLVRDFNEEGVFKVVGTYIAADGAKQKGNYTVNVVAHKFGINPACWVGMQRDWDAPLPPKAVLESDNRMLFESLAQLPGGGWQTGLFIDQSEPRPLLSRLGSHGPILDSTSVQGFNFWHGKDTMVRALQTYEDGSQLVEMLLVMSPVVPDVVVQLDVIVGGVIFEDGTSSRRLTAKDFDGDGQCLVRFIRPASAKTSVCHSITVLQAEQVVGAVR